MAFITSTDDLFEDEIMKSPSAVVQFSATWCGPCQTLKPIMKKVSEENVVRKKLEQGESLEKMFAAYGIL